MVHATIVSSDVDDVALINTSFRVVAGNTCVVDTLVGLLLSLRRVRWVISSVEANLMEERVGLLGQTAVFIGGGSSQHLSTMSWSLPVLPITGLHSRCRPRGRDAVKR